MKADDLINALHKELKTSTQSELAEELGISEGALSQWKSSSAGAGFTAHRVASALVKSRSVAIEKNLKGMIKPIVEFYPIDISDSARGSKKEVIRTRDGSTPYAKELKNALKKSCGIYIFYDAYGQALYLGKAEKQDIWTEMKEAYNYRTCAERTISLVDHPKDNLKFQPSHEQPLPIKKTLFKLYDLAYYFSAYDINKGAITELEAFLIRCFANNLMNDRMEKTFAHKKE